MNPLYERRREIVLGVLVVAIAVVVWHNLAGDGAGPAVVTGPRRGPVARVDLSAVRVFPVLWGALEARGPAYDPSGRNVFQYGAIPAPTPPPLTREEQEAVRRAQEQAEQERLAREAEAAAAAARAREEAERLAREQALLPPPPPPKPVPPPIPYKFIGYFGPPERKIAVLSDGAALLHARAGDEVGKGFRILEIGYESIKFGFTDPQFKGETQTLPMSSGF